MCAADVSCWIKYRGDLLKLSQIVDFYILMI